MTHDKQHALAVLAKVNPLPGELAGAFADRFDLDSGIAEAIARGSTVPPQRRVAPRRTLLAAAACALAIGVASALAIVGRPTIDFLSAKQAPTLVLFRFERGKRLHIVSFMKHSSVPLSGPARRITDVVYGERHHVLIVAPAKGGGFCDYWRGTFFGSGCVLSRNAANRLRVQLPHDRSGPVAIDGSFLNAAGERLEVTFADGSTDEIRAVWVTRPIDAGFFLYDIPTAHRRAGNLPVAVSLLDTGGHVLARTKLR